MNLNEMFKKFTEEWTQAIKQPFTDHPTAVFFRQDLKSKLEEFIKSRYSSFEVKASVGAGNWANVPWISILNPSITTTTQDGIYPVYLFRADGSGFYLSLNQGTTLPAKSHGKQEAERQAQLIKRATLERFPALKVWGQQDIDLKAQTSLGKSYEAPNISAKFYDSNAIPSSDILHQDLLELLEIYKGVPSTEAFKQPESKHKISCITILSKPFLLLAGISGTGKTRFVREQAKTSGSLAETYCLTSVRPDWHEPSDLLGYVSRLEGEARFVTTDVLIFIAKAWRALIDAGLTLNAENSEPSDSYPLVSGAEEMLNSIPPYWLCLDEMNLAPVEQYFADYLSVLETREWLWEDDTFYYRCDALLKPSTISSVANKEQLRTDLGFDSPAYDALWEFICDYGMSLPFNLIVAGTVNMDETTHGFSRKVIDRALSFDFGEFFPNRYDEFFAPTIVNSTLSYPRLAQATRDQLQLTKDTDGSKTLAFLTNINRVLERTPFELAYRALNELFLAVICSQPKDDLALKAVWDDFLMCKVLPRIEGDIDKLKTKEGKCLLTTLEAALSQELAPIWDAEQGKLRPDLYRERQASGEQEQMLEAVHIPCRTRQKLAWMKQRLDDSTFTSFWP